MRRRMRDQRGFTVAEVAVAGLVLIIGVLGALTLFDAASLRTLANKQREGANSLVRQLEEQVRAVPYSQLNDNTIAQRMQQLPGLGDSDGGQGGWQIKRGTTYTVTARTCTVDDPKDGVGANVGTDFCGISTGSGCQSTIDVSGQVTTPTTDVRLCLTLGGETISTLCGALGTSASGTIGEVVGGIGANGSANLCSPSTRLDDNPNDYKLALFVVSWNDGAHHDRQATIVPNPGEGAGPAITDLSVTSTSASSIAFQATTEASASNVQWSVDGSIQGRATLVGDAASFTWNTTGVADGTYIIGARAYDDSGTPGVGTTRSVTINRGPPAAPTGLAAGRNGAIMDFEWDDSSERDIVGYRVFQQVSGGTDVELCGLTDGTSCRDDTPPSTNPISVYVVAYDRDSAGNLRAGAHSTVRTVTNSNHPPGAPRSLTGFVSSGSASLTWLPPLVADPDLGDSIAFYRIYRGGQSYGDRYDKATCTVLTCTYTDTHRDGTAHTYSVTSVDTNLAESAIVGPVTA